MAILIEMASGIGGNHQRRRSMKISAKMAASA